MCVVESPNVRACFRVSEDALCGWRAGPAGVKCKSTRAELGMPIGMLLYMHLEPTQSRNKVANVSQVRVRLPLRLYLVQYKCSTYASTQFSQNQSTYLVIMRQQYVHCTAKALR